MSQNTIMAESDKVSDQEQQQQALILQEEKSVQPSKQLIATKVTGTVKWFNVRSGYGFINRNDTKEDVFVHQTAVIKDNPKKAIRYVVEFDVVVGEKGTEAANVTGPNGEPVRDSPFFAYKSRSFRPWMNRNRRRTGGNQNNRGGGDGDGSGQDGDGGQQRFQPRRYRRGRGRFNNYYYYYGGGRRRSNRNQSSGGGKLDQNADSTGDEGGRGGQRNRSRGGQQRRFFRRSYGRGQGGKRRPRSQSDGGQNGGSTTPRRIFRFKNANKKNTGNASNVEEDLNKENQQVQNTTEENSA